jgi:uncharacterized membrane protein YbhN (UPF0104 family)
MSKRFSGRSLIRTLGTIIALALMVYLLAQQGWEDILDAFREIELWRLLVAFGLTLVSRFTVAGRWYILLRSSEIDISPSQSLRLTFAGLFSANFLPTTVGGDVVRLAGAIQLGYDGAVSAASLVVDRLIGMAGMALALPIGVARLWQTGFPVSAQAAVSLSVFNRGWFSRLNARLKSLWVRLFRALSLWAKRPQALFGALLFTLLHMACLFGIINLLLDGMGEHVPFWLIAGLWSFVYFVTLVPISINGLGVQEISTAFVFASFGGVSETSALIMGLLVRTFFTFVSLPGAIFLPAILPGVKDTDRPEMQAPLPEDF